jgi:hypothetical protein
MKLIDPSRTPLPSDYSSEFGYQNITAPGVYPYRPVPTAGVGTAAHSRLPGGWLGNER